MQRVIWSSKNSGHPKHSTRGWWLFTSQPIPVQPHCWRAWCTEAQGGQPHTAPSQRSKHPLPVRRFEGWVKRQLQKAAARDGPWRQWGQRAGPAVLLTPVRPYQGFPLACFSNNNLFSSSENCKSSSKEFVSRSWMYCSMLLPARWGSPASTADRECEEEDADTCMQPNWLRRLSYCGENNQ